MVTIIIEAEVDEDFDGLADQRIADAMVTLSTRDFKGPRAFVAILGHVFAGVVRQGAFRECETAKDLRSAMHEAPYNDCLVRLLPPVLEDVSRVWSDTRLRIVECTGVVNLLRMIRDPGAAFENWVEWDTMPVSLPCLGKNFLGPLQSGEQDESTDD